MGVQFQNVMQASDMSLTLILDDIMRQRRDGMTVAPSDHEDWLNALLRQNTSLVYSASGRESLEAWLTAVEQSA